MQLWVNGPSRPPEVVAPEVRERVRAMYTDVLRRSREAAPAATPLAPPALDRLAEVRAPTLVVVGADDVPDVRAQADLLASRIPGARQVVVPHAAHVLNMEHPAATNRIILDFLVPKRGVACRTSPSCGRVHRERVPAAGGSAAAHEQV